jgi:hypothetical protein
VTIPQAVVLGTVITGAIGGVWAYTGGDRRLSRAYTGLALFAALCLSISVWVPNAGTTQSVPGAGLTAPLKP